MVQTARMIRIRLFGRPHLTEDAVPIKFKAPARALSLLAYLLVNGTAPLPRDSVAFALWPDDMEADARANLRRHLFYLTNDVLPAPPPKLPWILADKRTIGWNLAAPAWCDVREFEQLDAGAAGEAVELYAGDLLEGFEDEWLQAPRERLREQQLRLLLGLIESSRMASAYEAAIGYARRLLAIDPWREDGIRALIELRNATGDRAGALSTYRNFVKRLEAEMGVAPMAETTAVFDRVATAKAPRAIVGAPTASAANDLAESPDGPQTAAEPADAAFVPSPFWRPPESISNPEAVRPVPSFTGRDQELAQLEAALWGPTGQAAIHGLGGIGKSALAREYARRNRDRYAAVWSLNAETEAGIIDGLVRLGSEFVPALAQLDDRRAAAERVAANILSGLTKPVLLVFDNLTDQRLLRKWYPSGATQTLVTSRQAAWAGDMVTLRLEALAAADSVRYLQREIGRPDLRTADALLLAQTLGSLPLALAHAAAYLKGNVNVSAGRYLERLNDHLGRTPRGVDYDRAVYATFREAVSRAESEAPGATALICLAACFAPDALPEELLAQPADVYGNLTPLVADSADPPLGLHAVATDALGREEALGALHRYSLLTLSLETRTYAIHRLVQAAARTLQSADWAWQDCAVAAAEAAFPGTDFDHWPACERLIPHARAALDALPPDTVSAPAARLALRCGEYLRRRAVFTDAEVLLRRSVAIAERCAAGGAYADIAEHIDALAALLRDTNRLAQAEPLHRRSIALCEAALGPDHPRVATALNELAILLHYSNRLAETEALYRRALAIDKARCGDHPLIALRLHNLALVLHETNRLAEAEQLLVRALKIDERTYGGQHPDVASDAASLGWLMLESGRIAAAEPLLRRSLAIREAAFGPQHPSFAHALCDMAVLLQDSARSNEAAPLYRQALAVYEASYGERHPVVAACLNNVVELLTGEGRFDEAELLQRRALANDEATFGPDHSNIARDLNTLAGTLAVGGNSTDAEPLVQRALEILEPQYGWDHPRVQRVAANVALLRTGSAAAPDWAPKAAEWRYIRRSPSRALR
jgi:DNA-binding SARP family transcriptional activator